MEPNENQNQDENEAPDITQDDQSNQTPAPLEEPDQPSTDVPEEPAPYQDSTQLPTD